MARVFLDELTKVFDGNVLAVDHLTLEIQDGEFLVLVGPSGCGKTTVLRLVAGLEEPTRGNIWIGNRLVNEVAPRDRDVAMVFQNYALYPHMTVYENLTFGLRMRRRQMDLSWAEIDRRAREVARTLGIESILTRKPWQLSGGQRQRVALGRALVRRPQVFLLDEPLSNLDTQLRGEVRRELKELHQSLKATILYVTHDQVEALTLGDRVAVLDRGVLQQVDTPRQLYQRPVNVFVARFIGTPPMNLVSGTLVQEGGVWWFRGDGVSFTVPAEQRPGRLAELGRDGVVWGIRPEDLAVRPLTPAAAVRVVGTVSVAEPVGSEQIVYLTVGSGSLAAVLSADEAVEPRQVLQLWAPLERCHWFASGTGQRLE
jgi:multiple sugar transport system ATP-binding protein